MADYREIRTADGRITRIYNDGRVEYRNASTGAAMGPTNVNVGKDPTNLSAMDRFRQGLSAGWQNWSGGTRYKTGNPFIDAITGAGRFAGTQMSGADDIRRGVERARQGDWLGVGKSILGFGTDYASTLIGGGSGKLAKVGLGTGRLGGITFAGKVLPRGAGIIAKTIDTGVNVKPVIEGVISGTRQGTAQRASTAATAIPRQDSALDLAKAQAWAEGRYTGPLTPIQSALAKGFIQNNMSWSRPETTTVLPGSTTGGTSTTKTNVPPPSKELPGVSAAEQLALDEARRSAQAQYESILNQISTSRTQGSIQAEAGKRAAGRAGVGQQLDLGSYLGELGYSAAPAQLGVGRAAISESEAAARAAEAQGFTDLQAKLAGQTMTAEDARRLALMKLLAQETAMRAGRSTEMLNQIYGG